MPRLRKFRPGKDLEIGEVRLRGDVADGAAFRSGAEQRALRTAQHLDALEVEDRGQRIVGTEAERAHLDRRVVDIDPGRPCARARRNAADADLVLTGIELHARLEPRQILERFDPLLADPTALSMVKS